LKQTGLNVLNFFNNDLAKNKFSEQLNDTLPKMNSIVSKMLSIFESDMGKATMDEEDYDT